MPRITASIYTGQVSAHDVTRVLMRDGNPTVRSPSGLLRSYRSAIHVPRPLLAIGGTFALHDLQRHTNDWTRNSDAHQYSAAVEAEVMNTAGQAPTTSPSTCEKAKARRPADVSATA